MPTPGPAQKFGAEALGSFFATLVPTAVDVLYFTGEHVDFVSRWLARGFITTALIYALSEISGAHVDPAVSFGFAVRGDITLRKVFAYWAVQFAGAFAAAGLAFMVWGHDAALGASHPGPHYLYGQAFAAEVIMTALLMLVILSTAEQHATVGKQAALAVGLTVATCGFFGGPISGASMNPARSIAPQILGGEYNLIWLYALGPLIGAAIGAILMRCLVGPSTKGEKEAARGK